MTHPIIALQTSLLAALAGDTALGALIGENAVFDAPPKGKSAPFVAIARHDLVPRDGDAAPGFDHRAIVHVWHPEPNRAAALAIVERIIVVASNDLSPAGLTVTNFALERTDTAIDPETGQGRAALTLRFFTEPYE